ncbi:MAG: L-arabinose isomerase [Pelosinus sp.]|jgi:L-arabinose isomerase|nr:L-arabinose isomerase [Pelosinus sp.]
MFRNLQEKEVWFITGSQHLYGEETLREVAEHSRIIAQALGENDKIPVKIIFKPILTNPDAIYDICLEANNAKNCIGLIAWMHTFSPAKMWIGGLTILNKPLAHLHTQYNCEIPWSQIDMDFMNTNQSAHGDREFGFICSRMKKARKVIVGFWQEEDVIDRLAAWCRAALAWNDWQGAKFARFGDNMREVAVTEGDKVEAQMKFGYSVNGYALGDLVKYVNSISASQIKELITEYEETYLVQKGLSRDGAQRASLEEAAKLELGMKSFLEAGHFKGFTTNFENLYGLSQLPGLASQRLMAAGYGFGAEGDWKTAALVRAMKVMSYGLKGGTSFMEDYTYHLEEGKMKVLGSHMLEVCPTIAEKKPSLEIHPLSIGGKDDPARLVFDVAAGRGLNATILDLGNRFRLLVNEVDVVSTEYELPNLPVARALWVPQPDLKIGAHAWILAGGAHHTGFSQAVTKEHLEDFSEMAGVEYMLIDKDTRICDFKKELRWNDLYYHLLK